MISDDQSNPGGELDDAPAVLRSRGGTDRSPPSPSWREGADSGRPLCAKFAELGFSFAWHDFECDRDQEWPRSLHAQSLAICLNVAGHGKLAGRGAEIDFAPLTAGFYPTRGTSWRASRRGAERHQFVTLELAGEFVRRHLAGQEEALLPMVRQLVEGRRNSAEMARPWRLSVEQQELIRCLHAPPVVPAAQTLWYQSRAIELMAWCFFRPAEELFCQRQKRVASERVGRVITLLRASLVEPPNLEEIGRQVGCSPFYLSRTFSRETGHTIPQYLRRLRMERAAELLRSGAFNVTEAALEVGYSSLSHFSAAFHETFGCCPGLYPARTPTQLDPAQSAVKKWQPSVSDEIPSMPCLPRP